MQVLTDPNKKAAVIRNAFYLAGYIIECIYTYAVCDLIGTSQNQDVSTIFDRSYGVSYRYAAFPNITQPCILSRHDLHMKADFIKSNGGTDVDEVPLISSSIRVPTNLINLYNSWGPEIRYKCTHTISEREITDFILLAERVRTQILNFIAP